MTGDFKHKPNSGSAFRNRRKERDSQADLTGDVIIEVDCPHCGKLVHFDMWLNIWRKVDRNGDEWFSTAFNPRRPRAEGEKPTPKKIEYPKGSDTGKAIDDDIPFS
jgi:hypothetical protein